MKAMKNCKYICSKCPFDDCTFDGVTLSEIKRQDDFDKSILPTEPEVLSRRFRQSKYEKTEKGRNRHLRYNKTEKKKQADARYYQKKKAERQAELLKGSV